MNDKTAIEKAREAIEAIETAKRKLSDMCHGRERWHMSIPADPLNDPDIVIADGLHKAQEALEALAALDAEKPVEDAVSIRVDTDSIREAVIKIGMNFMRSFMFAAEIDLIKFVEAYHAAQCKACKAHPKESDDFTRFEKRSGITTDVDYNPAEAPDAENRPLESE